MVSMNKKGWIRTLEAVIAILLILGFTLYVMPKTSVYADETPQAVKSSQNYIIKQFLEMESGRQCLMKANFGNCENCNAVSQLIKDNKPAGYDYACEICSGSLSCFNVHSIAEKSVYTSAIMITSGDNARVLRIYFWEG